MTAGPDDAAQTAVGDATHGLSVVMHGSSRTGHRSDAKTDALPEVRLDVRPEVRPAGREPSPSAKMRAVTGFAELPESAVWRHGWSREGYEVTFLQQTSDSITLRGSSLGVEADRPWSVDYVIELDTTWVTRSAVVTARAGTVQRSVALQSAGPGAWLIDGRPAPALSGCHDVDLDVSVVTNAIPLHRLRLDLQDTAQDLDPSATPAPAAYIQAADLKVSRLDQSYRRRAGTSALVFDYRCPAFDFRTDITYDHAGLVRDYPGIAVRVR